MKNTIQQVDANTYTTKSGNTDLVLQVAKIGGWYVMATNPATKAWGTMGVKFFHTLADVEKKYKAFNGISKLMEA